MANLATFMATMLFKGKHFSVPRTPTWSNIAIANSPREALATRRTTRSRVLLLRSCFRGCDHKVSLSKQPTRSVLLAYVFLLRGEWTSIPAQKISQGNLVSLRATFSVCAREGPLEVLLFYGVENFWITLQFNDPTIGKGVKGKSRAIVRRPILFLLSPCVRLELSTAQHSTADLSLLTLVNVLLQLFTTSSYAGPYFDTGWSFHTASVFYGSAHVTIRKLCNGCTGIVL